MVKSSKIPRILEDAQDITVVAHPKEDLYIFAAKPSPEFQGEAFQASLVDQDVRAFQEHWRFDGKQGIGGSSTFLGLRLDQKSLRPQKLWIPGLLEAKSLEAQGKLENSVFRGAYRDYGIVAFGGEKRGGGQLWNLIIGEKELPLIVPFRALTYDVINGAVNVSFTENPQGIVSGEEAVRQIKTFNYGVHNGSSGIFRLVRGFHDQDDWTATHVSLAYSYHYGLVDWICGEAPLETLKQAHESLLNRKGPTQMQAEREKFENLLKL